MFSSLVDEFQSRKEWKLCVPRKTLSVFLRSVLQEKYSAEQKPRISGAAANNFNARR